MEPLPNVDFRLVRRRVEFLLEVKADDRPTKLATDTGLRPSVVYGILNHDRQALSQESASRIADAYGVSLEFLYRGRRDGVCLEVQDEIDRWIAGGRWSIEDRAPVSDRGK